MDMIVAFWRILSGKTADVFVAVRADNAGLVWECVLGERRYDLPMATQSRMLRTGKLALLEMNIIIARYNDSCLRPVVTVVAMRSFISITHCLPRSLCLSHTITLFLSLFLFVTLTHTHTLSISLALSLSFYLLELVRWSPFFSAPKVEYLRWTTGILNINLIS